MAKEQATTQNTENVPSFNLLYGEHLCQKNHSVRPWSLGKSKVQKTSCGMYLCAKKMENENLFEKEFSCTRYWKTCSWILGTQKIQGNSGMYMHPKKMEKKQISKNVLHLAKRLCKEQTSSHTLQTMEDACEVFSCLAKHYNCEKTRNDSQTRQKHR